MELIVLGPLSLISDILVHGLSSDSGNLPSFSVVQFSKKFFFFFLSGQYTASIFYFG